MSIPHERVSMSPIPPVEPRHQQASGHMRLYDPSDPTTWSDATIVLRPEEDASLVMPRARMTIRYSEGSRVTHGGYNGMPQVY
jgi:hypothetical protein